MQVVQFAKFQKKYKKLHDNQAADVNTAIRAIMYNPSIGQMKSANLAGIRVYKFKMVGQLTLLAYYVTDGGDLVLTLLDFGSHENFYRDLKI